MKSICFVGRDSYPVLSAKLEGEYIGGEAVQQTLLARAFRDAGYKVSMISQDYGQPDGEVLEDITCLTSFNEHSGIPVLRFVHPRLTGLYSAMARANADIYFQSCAGVATGYSAHFCRRHKKTSVFRLASDTDCKPGEYLIDYKRDHMIYEYGLRNSQFLSAQSALQQQLLQANYALPSHLINMVCELPEQDTNGTKDIDVLWVSNIRECKRPDRVVELAKMLPALQFTMVGGPTDEQELFTATQQQAEALPNLHFAGHVDYANVGSYFARSRLFLNTSDIEGFPNTFLQAWAQGVPVVSFFDPDATIAREKLGAVPVDLPAMAQSLTEWMQDAQQYSQAARHVRAFVEQKYSGPAVVASYEAMLFANG